MLFVQCGAIVSGHLVGDPLLERLEPADEYSAVDGV